MTEIDIEMIQSKIDDTEVILRDLNENASKLGIQRTTIEELNRIGAAFIKAMVLAKGDAIAARANNSRSVLATNFVAMDERGKQFTTVYEQACREMNSKNPMWQMVTTRSIN